MNLPNKLTLFRIILIPFLLLFISFDVFNNMFDLQTRRYIACAIFAIASITDALDGYIARKYNLITNFGKFMDPLADKLLVSATMIALINMPDSIVPLHPIIVILIISREFLITGFRTIAIEKNIVISAGMSGKIKTVFQMAMLVVLLLNIDNMLFTNLSYFLIIGSVVLTIYSAVEYIVQNKEVLKD
ncbi:MAG: CDP-diacylglycerol--glycerol-3-phosphate 3-phosphatidyltransferase [bacterium]